METVKNIKLNLNHVATSEDLAISAFNMFVDFANKSIKKKGSFNVAISGGHTPIRFFELLGSSLRSKVLEWDKVQIFWADERFVPPDDEASNYGVAARTFLDEVQIPPENVHRMPGESNDYAEAVCAYERTIRKVFKLDPGQIPEFDFIFLGMGANGHIGSLFPASYALFDTDDLVSVVYFMDGNYNRMTLTHPVLCSASLLAILVSGHEKARILKEVLQSEPDVVKYPAHALWPILDKVTWIVDDEAAKSL